MFLTFSGFFCTNPISNHLGSTECVYKRRILILENLTTMSLELSSFRGPTPADHKDFHTTSINDDIIN